jgi:protein-tyrosine phosphatase
MSGCSAGRPPRVTFDDADIGRFGRHPDAGIDVEVIDIHCHILPGIDDGPARIEDSLALARAAADAGTRVLIATPHVSWAHRNNAATIGRLVRELNARLVAEGIDLEVLSGAEIATTLVTEIPRRELEQLTLAGGGYLLIEPPFTPIVSGIEMTIYGLQRDGYRIVLAHPERCAAFHRDRRVLENLVAGGALSSITAGSLVGRFGRDVRRFAHELVADGLAHNVASDAHDAARRAPGIGAELEQAGLAPLAPWLTESVPRAILAGSEIPARPRFEPASPPSGWLKRVPWRAGKSAARRQRP